MDISLYDEAVSGRLKVGDIVYNKYTPTKTFTIAKIERRDMGNGDIKYWISNSVSDGFMLVKNDDRWKRFIQRGGKNRRKSRRNKKTKRRKSKRRC
jgi:hypothetical protein